MSRWPSLATVVASVTLSACSRCAAGDRLPLASPSKQQIERETEQVQHLRCALEREGLWGFFARATSEGWSTPWIRSKYWVDGLPREEAGWIALEESKRALGKALAEMVDAESLDLVGPESTKTREEHCEQLLRAAGWVRQSRGYGNLLLSTRLDNLAYVQIGYLTADLQYDMARVDALIHGVAPLEEDLALRLAVLEEEVPPGITVPRGQDVAAMNDRLEEWWARNVARAFDWCKRREIPITTPRSQSVALGLPRDPGFFIDDELPLGPHTPATLWDLKQHQAYCVLGANIVIRTSVDSFCLFRRKVGRFPTEPPERHQSYHTPIQAAFVEAWDPFRHEYGPMGGTPGRVFEDVQANRLMDYDTYQLAQQRRRQSGPVVDAASRTRAAGSSSQHYYVRDVCQEVR